MGAAAKSVLELRPGDVIQDKYRIVRELGRGGMGVVYAADHLQLRQPVAIKLMLRGADARSLERFQREARIVAQLQSQHVCKLLDVGARADGSPFMVMEMLEGETLTDTLRSRGALRVEDAVDFVLQAAEALAEAHGIGAVHRDIKPSNLFVTQGVDGQPMLKLLDFGISKILSGDGHTLTESGELVGSPRFMSPEQLQRHLRVDARTDVWALGAVLYELITGRAAFQGESLAELVVLILQEEPDPIGAVRDGVANDLQHAIARCLHKNADRRFANMAELAMALGPFAGQRGRSYVERISRIVGATGWSPSHALASAPATVPDRPAAHSTISSEPAPPTMPTRQAFNGGALTHSTIVPSGTVAPASTNPAQLRSQGETMLSRPREGQAGVARGWLVGGVVAVLVGALVAAFGIFSLVTTGGQTADTSTSPDDNREAQAPRELASDDPFAERLGNARAAKTAGQFIEARAELETLLLDLKKAKVKPASVHGRVGAEAQYLLAQIVEAQTERARPPTTLREAGRIGLVTPTVVLEAYRKVLVWQQNDFTQCANTRMGLLSEKDASWFLSFPAPADARDKPDELERLRRTNAVAWLRVAHGQLGMAAVAPIMDGKGCRDEAATGRDRVAKTLAALGAKPK